MLRKKWLPLTLFTPLCYVAMTKYFLHLSGTFQLQQPSVVSASEPCQCLPISWERLGPGPESSWLWPSSTSTSRYSSRSSQKWAAWAPSSFKPAGGTSWYHTHILLHQTRIFSKRYPPPSVSQKDNPINAKQDTILMLLNIHFFFKCQNFTSDTQLRMMLFVKTENTGKWNQFLLERKECVSFHTITLFLFAIRMTELHKNSWP